MKLFGILSFTLLLSALTTQAEAQTDSVKHFSLAEAQQYALDNFYMSKNAELDIESAKWRVWETTAIGLPQVTASGSYQHIPGDIPELSFGMDSLFNYLFSSLIDLGYPPPDNLMGSNEEGSNAIAPKNTFNYSITVSQLVFSGEYIVGLQASRVYKLMSQEANEKTAIELKQSVADTYFTILILEDNLGTLRKTLDNLRSNLDQVRKSYELGLMEDTDVDQLNLSVKRTENELASMERQIEYLQNMFKYQLGLKPTDEVTLKDELDLLITENVVNDSAYVFTLEDNIDYRILDTQEKLMKLSMRREQSKYLPSVAAFYQYQDKTEQAQIDFTINHMVGVNIEVPIMTSGSRIAKVSQARIEYEKALNMKEQETTSLVIAAQQARYDYQTALEKYKNEQLNFELSEKVYDKTTAKYKEGMTSSLELSLINNQYLQAQLSYSMAVQQLLSAKVKLDKAYNKL